MAAWVCRLADCGCRFGRQLLRSTAYGPGVGSESVAFLAARAEVRDPGQVRSGLVAIAQPRKLEQLPVAQRMVDAQHRCSGDVGQPAGRPGCEAMVDGT